MKGGKRVPSMGGRGGGPEKELGQGRYAKILRSDAGSGVLRKEEFGADVGVGPPESLGREMGPFRAHADFGREQHASGSCPGSDNPVDGWEESPCDGGSARYGNPAGG